MESITIERYVKTIGEKSTLQLLKVLQEGLMSVSHPAISQHMKWQEVAQDERHGKWIDWSINTHPPKNPFPFYLLEVLPIQTIDKSKETT
ncbi:hypothetical protein [Sporosarcina obsidiansis]|uniref:hypothetical protein n=1 Tax=Sporosarcina obsidiansis TaxID=2660748 RepID=UPI00129B5451|nr:hypothetical protein [Sporosarcina obsidiansis]